MSLFGSSGKQAEVVINAEHEVSATEATIVTLVGEVEAKKEPTVKVEAGGNVVLEEKLESGGIAEAGGLRIIGSFVLAAGVKYKVPTVAGLAKLFATTALVNEPLVVQQSNIAEVLVARNAEVAEQVAEELEELAADNAAILSINPALEAKEKREEEE